MRTPLTQPTAYTHPFSSILIGDPIPAATHSRRHCRSDDGNPVSNRSRFCLDGRVLGKPELHFDIDMEPENDCAWKPKQGMTFDSEQCANVEGKLSAHFGVGKEIGNDGDTQSFEVDCEDVNHVVQPKGLKKKVATSKGKKRVKGGFEAALVANSKKKSRANSLASSQSIASSTVAPPPLSIGGDIYVRQHVPSLQPLPPLHPLPPSLPMGGNSIPPPLMYPTYHTHNLREMYVVPNYLPNSMPQRHSAQPTFQSLLQGSCGYDIGFRYSQESTSPMCSQAMDKQKQKQTDAEIGLESEVMASEIVKQIATGK
ncbi:unnamed protein product [Camellia sinensis]